MIAMIHVYNKHHSNSHTETNHSIFQINFVIFCPYDVLVTVMYQMKGLVDIFYIFNLVR